MTAALVEYFQQHPGAFKLRNVVDFFRSYPTRSSTLWFRWYRLQSPQVVGTAFTLPSARG